MKKIARAAAGFASAVLATVGIVCVGVRVPGGAIQKAAGAAAGFIMPSENIESLFHDEAEEDDGSASSHRPSSPVSAKIAQMSVSAFRNDMCRILCDLSFLY